MSLIALENEELGFTRSVTSTEKERSKIAQLTKEFLAKGGKILMIPDNKRTISYNNNGLRDDVPMPKWFNNIKLTRHNDDL